MRKETLPLAGLVLIFLSGCTVYKISTQSLTDQLRNTSVEGKAYIGDPESVKGNNLASLQVVDKNGATTTLPITNRTGIRITKTDNTRTTFYANTVLLKDSSLVGSKTHFFNAQIHPVPLSEITTIEVMP
jgi:hypothetical protein